MKLVSRTLLSLCFALPLLFATFQGAHAAPSPTPVPVNSLGVHKMVLTNDGVLYLRMNNPVGAGDYTAGANFAATINLAQLFPTPQSFATFNSLSSAQRSAQLVNAGSFVDWDETVIDPDEIVAEATVLLDLNETHYATLQKQFTNHVGAMFHAWYVVLQNPFSSGKEALRTANLIADGQLCTEETWGIVGEWVGAVASAAWEAGKWVANKILPVAQAVELCVTATNIVITSIEAGEFPEWEDMAELCFDAVECIPGGWGVGAAVVHEAWCWMDI